MGLFFDYFQKPLDSLALYLFTITLGRNETLYYWFHQWWEQGVDPRTKGYAFVDMSGTSITTIVVGYVLLVVYIIPKYMENRKAYNLRKTIIVYDILLVIINAYFFLYSLYHIRDMFDFSNPKYDTSEKAIKFINTAHLYYLSKILDLLDTVFMALKKKNSHITFLHVWHHLSMPGGGWMFMRYNPYIPSQYILPLLNGFVHIVMYGYYGLAALGPHIQKYLWWKKYITQMQLIQFTIGLIWIIITIFKATDYPFFFLALNLVNDIALFLLFLNFYIRSYNIAKKQQLKSK